jgi:hypothetical protein
MAAVLAKQSVTTLRRITEGMSLLDKTLREGANGNVHP